MPKLSLVLTNKVSPSDRDALTQRFVSSEDILVIIKEVLQSKLQSDITARRSISSYSFPAWSEYQADGVGYQRALTEVIDLLTFRE